jgi:lipoic acid synthetase
VIQLAAILSVVVLYYKQFFDFKKIGFYIKLVIALIPAIVAGVLLKKHIDAMLGNIVFIAVIMILGGVCTRSCQFCDVPTGRPLPPDPNEPEHVAMMLAELGLRHTVITCVDRDDLPDGGAAHWAATIRAVKRASPDMVLEVLTGDFKGDTGAVDVVLAAEPDVFAHNLETVPRLSRQVRVQASYARSYAILRHAKGRGAITKTGLMLGLGEELDELRVVFGELREIGVDILTLGQYLRPSPKHLPVARFAPPDEFAALKEEALAMGFPHVESGPMVRSSYHADGQRDIVLALRNRT